MRKHLLNKKLAVSIAVILLIVASLITFVACNTQDSFEKRLKNKGYDVERLKADELDEYMEEYVNEVEWALVGTIGNPWIDDTYEFVIVIKCKNLSDAEDAGDRLTLAGAREGFEVVRKVDIIIFGTEKAVEDAQ